MKHHDNCRDPSQTTIIHLSAHERARQCNFCGAFERGPWHSAVITVDFSELERRVVGHAEFSEQFLCTPTGRRPSEPELQDLPRPKPRRGHTLCLTTNPSGGDLRWTNTLMLGMERIAHMFIVQIDDLAESYCPVRFLPFYDIHARDREAKR